MLHMRSHASDVGIRRAIISVHDKSGVVEFARALSAEFGVEIISTGGTARLLRESGIPVTPVETVTGLPEMMDGRVKTLHPHIHAGILADRDNPEHMLQLTQQGIQPIDMVVVSLYPFEKTVADPACSFENAIEMIDIGGPCMLRAAAKNHHHVLVVSDSGQYDTVLTALRRWADPAVREDIRRRCARSAFAMTSAYDRQVSVWLSERSKDDSSGPRSLELWSAGPLRYGENPHQRAERWFWSRDRADALMDESTENTDSADVAASFNNLADANAAIELCRELVRAGSPLLENDRISSEKPPAVCVFVKHTNACGVGVAEDPAEAYRRAYMGDPNAAMGGVLCCSFAVDSTFAETVMHTFERLGKSAGAGGFFVEVWAAPSFSTDAIRVIRESKPWGRRVRLIPVSDMPAAPDTKEWEYRRVDGGMLAQSRDVVGLNEADWRVVTRREPIAKELRDLRLAWLVAKHTKSNAVSLCAEGMLIGNGAGQMSRVMSCRVAVWLAGENGHADRLRGSAAASDAFFPFDDGPRFLAKAGVSAIIQPGGSKRDEDVIKACDELDVAMVFAGVRHFKH